MKENKTLIILIASSITMFISIFTMNYKLLGIGLLQWVIVVFLSFNSTIFKSFSLSQLTSYLNHETTNAWNERKYGKVAVYGSVIPMLTIGLLWVVLIIVCLLFIF